ncbi:hypothetical protein ACM46_18125 [Chryseobacterium angstadtii]|uniref:HTH luxR-type domain-containing protein n=1 Tax=Chryseobacterium angstadtii TaxID=558151 RepID=A0A0J7I1M4_9FLAO|nr:helix-turn-helix transcriptional regulator [Chryseobacterium angstadtii]KMQ60152.1 hypothetical protein ACM46_18125 [Chryseobacterium angstadtii]
MKKITPIKIEHYIETFKVHQTLSGDDYVSIFSETIKSVENFAIGPFYYIIASYSDYKVKAVSNNIEEMTPFSKDDFATKDFLSLSPIFHPDDLEYFLAALAFTKEIYFHSQSPERDSLKFNVYVRAMNRKREFKWVLIQSWFYTNQYNEIESILYVHYDLSHLNIVNMPLLSIINFNNKIQYFKHVDQKMLEVNIQPPHITNREREILKLMAEGYNTPQISDKLFISYHTVQNHKKNLRAKTNTKTSGELISFVLKYNLLWI